MALTTLTIKINNDMSAHEMTTRRDRFFNQISILRWPILVKNQEVSAGLTGEQAVSMINLFFEEMMGNGELNHLHTLIKCITQHEEDAADRGLGMRAENLANDDTLPALVAEFFNDNARQQQLVHSQGTLFRSLQQNLANVRLVNTINRLKHGVVAED